MDTFGKGSDLLSARLIAVTGLITVLASIGLGPFVVVLVCVALIFLLK
ncbi:hypothetical protein [Klebsiella variicola]|nr:hypothetical protein [Klebsiella variicola]MDM7055793.1 hypothetical protein [Klebsiella variicola]HCI8840561.1 hypothetical protein [Klebsiella variicola]